MQRIWIAGSSGSGKTTLANKLGKKFNIPVYHRDSITWGENWEERTEEEQIRIVREISKKDKWIFEGNRFTASKEDGRFTRCDTIIYISMNRVICLYRGLKRYLKHRNNPRPELPVNCEEGYNITIVKYVLFGYPRKKSARLKLFKEAEKKGINVVFLKGGKEVRRWCKKHEL